MEAQVVPADLVRRASRRGRRRGAGSRPSRPPPACRQSTMTSSSSARERIDAEDAARRDQRAVRDHVDDQQQAGDQHDQRTGDVGPLGVGAAPARGAQTSAGDDGAAISRTSSGDHHQPRSARAGRCRWWRRSARSAGRPAPSPVRPTRTSTATPSSTASGRPRVDDQRGQVEAVLHHHQPDDLGQRLPAGRHREQPEQDQRDGGRQGVAASGRRGAGYRPGDVVREQDQRDGQHERQLAREHHLGRRRAAHARSA